MKAFAQDTPEKQNLSILHLSENSPVYQKYLCFIIFFYKQVHHTKVCLHYPHLFVLEFDHHCVTCRVLALHHVWVDLGRDYHRILLTPERVLTEHKVGHGRGEAFS